MPSLGMGAVDASSGWDFGCSCRVGVSWVKIGEVAGVNAKSQGWLGLWSWEGGVVVFSAKRFVVVFGLVFGRRCVATLGARNSIGYVR